MTRSKLIFDLFFHCYNDDSFKPIAMKNKTQVTEQEFINLLKQHNEN